MYVNKQTKVHIEPQGDSVQELVDKIEELFPGVDLDELTIEIEHGDIILEHEAEL